MKEALCYYRKKKNKTQGEIAREVGITQQAYSKYEKGYPVPFDMMVSISNYLGIHMEHLLLVVPKKKEYVLQEMSEEELFFLFIECLSEEEQKDFVNVFQGWYERLSPFGKRELFYEKWRNCVEEEKEELYFKIAKNRKQGGNDMEYVAVKEKEGFCILQDENGYYISENKEERFHDHYLCTLTKVSSYEAYIMILIRNNATIVPMKIEYAKDDVLQTSEHVFSHLSDAESALQQLIS